MESAQKDERELGGLHELHEPKQTITYSRPGTPESDSDWERVSSESQLCKTPALSEGEVSEGAAAARHLSKSPPPRTATRVEAAKQRSCWLI